jgi:hypothetical protein
MIEHNRFGFVITEQNPFGFGHSMSERFQYEKTG